MHGVCIDAPGEANLSISMIWLTVVQTRRPTRYSPKFHDAGLRVEGEVRDIYVTRALVNCRWFPDDSAVAIQDGLVHDGHHIVSIGAANIRAPVRRLHFGWTSNVRDRNVRYLLVVENQIWPPNVIGRDMELLRADLSTVSRLIESDAPV